MQGNRAPKRYMRNYKTQYVPFTGTPTSRLQNTSIVQMVAKYYFNLSVMDILARLNKFLGSDTCAIERFHEEYHTLGKSDILLLIWHVIG